MTAARIPGKSSADPDSSTGCLPAAATLALSPGLVIGQNGSREFSAPGHRLKPVAQFKFCACANGSAFQLPSIGLLSAQAMDESSCPLVMVQHCCCHQGVSRATAASSSATGRTKARRSQSRPASPNPEPGVTTTPQCSRTVSYTHLTLPTILRV